MTESPRVWAEEADADANGSGKERRQPVDGDRRGTDESAEGAAPLSMLSAPDNEDDHNAHGGPANESSGEDGETREDEVEPDAEPAAPTAADADAPETPARRVPALALGSEEEVAATAPVFPAVHASWAAFDAQLKHYGQSTYQLYVVRTTTSVQRRNQRIAELASTHAEAGLADPAEAPERVLIPESWRWYSKTMMCTHGWKDRHRGTGKRAMSMVRSTGCPVKMCVTLQHHHAADGGGWQVVVTKHVRVHNHPLSKELYLFYTENRRIYDPEILALVGSSAIAPVGPRGRTESQSTTPSGSNEPSALSATAESTPRTQGTASGTDDGGKGDGSNDRLEGEAACRPPPMEPKVFNSWDAFHRSFSDYMQATCQQFRIRSTISAQSKNNKLLEQANRSGKSEYEALAQLIPEDEKWYSKLLICNHGWKRKSRSKLAQVRAIDATNTAPVCPAMIMVRLQRGVHDNWIVVLHRQILEHNHELREQAAPSNDVDTTATPDPLRDIGDLPTAATSSSITPRSLAPASIDLPDAPILALSTEPIAPELLPVPVSLPPRRVLNSTAEIARSMKLTEVVVRVPKLQVVHESWEAFHECLQQYSEVTFQSYRTRTTSSVKGRNQKIVEMKSNVASWERSPAAMRLIPENFKCYAKTLTCTHGWKERHRGSGKRTNHVLRSTACPVKICATLQYIDAQAESSSNASVSTGVWRVVVTRHIVDHNHNVSRELYQHYCDNRRIYDPDLLTIDQSRAAPTTTQQSFGGTTSLDLAHGPSFVLGPHESMLLSQGSFTSEHLGPGSDTSLFDSGHETTLLSGGAIAMIPYATGRHSDSVNAMLIPTAPPSNGQLQAQQHLLGHNASLAVYSPSFSQNTEGFPANMGIVVSTPSSVHSNDACQSHGAASNGASVAFPDSAGVSTCIRGEALRSYAVLGTTATNEQLHAPVAESLPNSVSTRPSSTSIDTLAPSNKRQRRGASLNRQSTDDVWNAGGNGCGEAVEETHLEDAPAAVWSPDNTTPVQKIHTQDGHILWRAPRMQGQHKSWAEFSSHLQAYSVATFQLYRVRTTSSVSARNARLTQQLGDAPENAELFDMANPIATPVLVPTEFEWYSKTFVCTHGWKERRRGKGHRVSHHLRSTECPVKLCATLQRDLEDGNKWHVIVTKHVRDHNHEISMSMFQSYSENRKIRDPDVLTRAAAMWREGQTRRRIFEFLKEKSQQAIVMKDVHNLVQRWQQQEQHEEVDQVNSSGIPDDRTVKMTSTVPSADNAKTQDSHAAQV